MGDQFKQSQKTCAVFEVVREHQVKNLQPVSSTVYAYYTPEIRTTIMVSSSEIQDLPNNNTSENTWWIIIIIVSIIFILCTVGIYALRKRKNQGLISQITGSP